LRTSKAASWPRGRCSVVLQVDELVGALEEVDDLALLDGDHVAGSRAGRDPLDQLGVVLAEVALGRLDDRDVRVVLHVLLVEVRVAELAERAHPQRDLLAG